MCKIPSDQNGVTADIAVRMPTLPVYIAPKGRASLSAVLVEFEAFLLDESGEQARYAHLQELAEEQRDEELAEQKRLQAEAALEEEKRRHEESALEAAMRRVRVTMEMTRRGCLSESEEESEEESERDSDSFVSSSSASSPSPSSSSSSPGPSSSDSDSEVVPFRPRPTKTKSLRARAPRKQRQRSKPYAKRAPKVARPVFFEFFTPDKQGKKTPLGENECWAHSIDWVNAPPTWNGNPIPAMPADDVLPWLKANYGVSNQGICRMGSCMHDRNPVFTSNLKGHLLASKHLNLRRMCTICRFALRDDMFKTRHGCESRANGNAAIIRDSPGPLVPSYTWGPSNL